MLGILYTGGYDRRRRRRRPALAI